MFKKLMLIILFFVSPAYAQFCPSPLEIRDQHFNEWHAYDRDNGLPVSSTRLLKFMKHVELLGLAEWAQSAPEGESHCYYFGYNHEDYLPVYLAKYHLLADKENGSWREVSPNIWQCKNHCAFKEMSF